MEKFATYHRRGWKDIVYPVAAHDEKNGTVDLADSEGKVFVTGLPLLAEKPEKETVASYATLASGPAADAAAAKAKAAENSKDKKPKG